MSEMQQQVLQSAVGRAQREMQNEIQGTWCDALACLLALEWPRARKHLLTPVPQSTSVVVQAWMQVGSSSSTPLFECGSLRRSAVLAVTAQSSELAGGYGQARSHAVLP